MKQIFFLIVIIFSFNLICNAQSHKSSRVEQSINVEPDSIYTIYDLNADSIIHVNLPEVEIIQPYSFKNRREEKKYGRLVGDVIKTYPLSLIVGRELSRVNEEFKDVYTEKKRRKKYIKWYEDYVYETYIDSVKALNIRQGKLLLKLIDRETGQSPYKLIKEYRGGGKAFTWRVMALLVGANLNARYKQEKEGMLEHIIKRYETGGFD